MRVTKVGIPKNVLWRVVFTRMRARTYYYIVAFSKP